MDSVITIGGVAYDAEGRADAGFVALDEVTVSFGGADQLSFTLAGVGPVPPFKVGASVVFSVDGDEKFVGDLAGAAHRQADFGWSIGFTAFGLRRRADRVPVAGSDGSGVAAFNLSPGDDYYVPSAAGQSVGDIIRRVLTVPVTAARLSALGVGNYDTLTPPTLPADTLADLALLDVVPPRPVSLAGLGVLNHCEDLAEHWHPKFAMTIRPDGTIRLLDLFDLTTVPLVIPGESGTPAADPVGWPSASRDADTCFTAIKVMGRNVQPAFLRETAGTMEAAFDPDDPDGSGIPWTIEDYLNPKDATDSGDLSSVTTSSATVTSDYPDHFWSTNFWPGREAWIMLFYPGGTGIDVHETRKITSNAALTAGGSASVSWDASDPLPSLDFVRYEIVGRATPRADVGRLYNVREPLGPLLGLDTWIGSHMVPRFPRPVPWRSGAAGYSTTTHVGTVCWSATGDEPWNEVPAMFEILPETGQIRFVKPVVMETTDVETLRRGYPTTFAGGKPADIKVMLAYDKGDAFVRVPSSGFEGTAYAEDEIEREYPLYVDSWTYGGDAANMAKLGREHLDTMKDSVIEGSILHHGYPSTFDPLTLGYALELSIAGSDSPWDATPLPVRSVTLRWPQGTGDLHELVFQFSNRKRPFQGEDLYVHPLDGGAAGFFGGDMPFGEADFMAPAAVPGAGMSPAMPSFGPDFIDPGVLALGSGQGLGAGPARRPAPSAPNQQESVAAMRAPASGAQADAMAAAKAAGVDTVNAPPPAPAPEALAEGPPPERDTLRRRRGLNGGT